MNGRELARLLGPLLGVEARPRLRALTVEETNEISMSYDEVRDWAVMEKLLTGFASELHVFDGEERFTVALGSTSPSPQREEAA